MKENHISTPWRFEHLGGKLHIMGGYDPAKRIIKVADIYGDGSSFPVEQAEANANFILMAVNAHDALLAVCEELVQASYDSVNAKGYAPYHVEELARANMAIAKAKGRKA